MKKQHYAIIFVSFVLFFLFLSTANAAMKNIASINGHQVYSDKQVKAIVNTKIYFTDGSWCDGATGQVVNNGAGYINIDAPPCKNDEKIESRTESFYGSSVSVKEIYANLEIQPYSGDKIIVTRNGGKSSIERIKVSAKGNSIVVEDKSAKNSKKSRGGGTNISTISGTNIVTSSSITVNNGFVTINNSGNNFNIGTNVKIQVPKGTTVDISNINGQATVGNIEGNVTITSCTGGDISIGSVKSAYVIIQGNSVVDIKNVKENLTVSIQGSGDVKVASGNVNLLNANIQGSGDFNYEGNAVNANLTVMGSGDIDVNYVKNRPITNAMGSGRIKIKNGIWRNQD